MINFLKSLAGFWIRLAIKLILLISVLIASEETIYLWDLGLKISPPTQSEDVKGVKKERENTNTGFAAIANRHLPPQKINLFKKGIGGTNEKESFLLKKGYNYKLGLGRHFFVSGRFVEAVDVLNSIDIDSLLEKQKNDVYSLKAKALFALGDLKKTYGFLIKKNKITLDDSILFIYGISAIEVNNRIGAIDAFRNIIENYPNSEYQKAAEMQLRVLKR